MCIRVRVHARGLVQVRIGMGAFGDYPRGLDSRWVVILTSELALPRCGKPVTGSCAHIMVMGTESEVARLGRLKGGCCTGSHRNSGTVLKRTSQMAREQGIKVRPGQSKHFNMLDIFKTGLFIRPYGKQGD